MNLEDIAKKAGVSRSTVSRVINEHPNVRESTRRKVLEIIDREGFYPNSAARTLVTQRTHVLGFVTPQALTEVFNDPYFPTVFQGISSVANHHDYAVMMWVGEGIEDEERFYQRIRHIGLIDGLIVASIVEEDPLFKYLVNDEFPFVLIGRPPFDGMNSVDVDNHHAARVAVEHLIHLGYERVATITGWLKMTSAQERLGGYYEALRQAGRPVDPALVANGNYTEQSGYMAMKTLLHRKVDAVFCASDMMAVGAMRAIHEANLNVPRDVALVGFDNVPISSAMAPALTTVRQPVRQLGIMAAEALINLLDGTLATPYRVILPTELIVRESCGAMLAIK